MLRTLYARLASALVLLFIAIGIAYAVISTSATRQYLQELTQRFNRDLAKRIVADRNLVAEGRLNNAALSETFSAYMDINPSIEIYLLDLHGRILSYSADPGKVKRQHVDLTPIQAFLRGEGFPLLGDDPRSHDRRKAFSVTPVPTGQAPEGYLYVVLRGEEFDSAEQLLQESYTLRLSAWAVAGSLGFGLLAGLLLFHLLTRRLQRLSTLMSGFHDSGFSQHLAYADRPLSGDEIDRVGAVFDGMAERIIAQFAQLKEQDRLRRELVAQISHDLRTPLASVHGYLETLDMHESLSEPEREQYLKVALRQSGRLKRMIEELFELARLEARDTQPRHETFPPAELVQDVVQKFKPRAHQRGIALSLRQPPELPFVLADLGLTERVLDNLIGNALDHTPKKGRVQLSLEALDEQVQISIADNGPGIADEDLPRIFEPFHRGKSSGQDKGHAGLGLAIAQRIVEIQGGSLSVRNLEQGARFSFTLPCASNQAAP